MIKVIASDLDGTLIPEGTQEVEEGFMEVLEELLEKDGFDRVVYMNMRKQLYEAIEWVFDVDLRHKLRNSWYSYGKAMDKKVPRN